MNGSNLIAAINKGGNNTEEVFLSIDGKIVDFTIMGVAVSDGAKILEIVEIPVAEKEATVDAPQEQDPSGAAGGTETTSVTTGTVTPEFTEATQPQTENPQV